jgi:hypothetical protein
MKKAIDVDFLKTLEARFSANMNRHPDIAWDAVRARLESRRDAVEALAEMERTGGEPDVVGNTNDSGSYAFIDCSKESPALRRNLCYDRDGELSRKDQSAAGNAMDMARDMGVSILTESDYRELQRYGAFDEKTSSWIATPKDIRSLGGALFADRRYDSVFIYHNGAGSYYGARGFRAILWV